ncbi:MAG: hypothetical protein V4505_27350 [Pseudomonadota bacterium]
MALWMTALKLVPWDDVIKATPKLVRQAQQVFRRSKAAETAGEAQVPDTVLRAGDPQALAALARALHERVSALEKEQQASAALMESLAEQHEMVVQALTAVRARTRLLAGVCGLLVVALVLLAAWVANHP